MYIYIYIYIYIYTSESDLGDDQEKCDFKDNTFHGKTPVLKRKNVNEQCQHQQPAPREPSGCDDLLVDGFTLVTNRKNNNKKDRPRTYREVAGHQQTRVFTNDIRCITSHWELLILFVVRAHGEPLDTIKTPRNSVRYLLDTTSSDLMKYLKAEYNEYFQI